MRHPARQSAPITAALLVFLTAGVSLAAAEVNPPFIARDGAIQIFSGGRYTPFFVHAVDLGLAVPGTQPGELAATRDQYRSWLARIRAMGFRAVRTYTLHYPRFYDALHDYNVRNPDAPLYLLHGVWLDEENPSGSLDLHTYTPIFTEGITQAVAAVHGNITIPERPERPGRAYGSYTNDVSPWLLGWIIGREVYPDEVAATDQAHTNDTSYAGTLISLPVGSPTECWVTARLDDLARYQLDTFGASRPLSFSSWPTLDPLEHPTESWWSYEDSYQIDLANLDTSKFAPGYFASYHAYPYYPDFMSEDPAYTTVRDLQGTNSYLGYLRAMRSHYYPVPLFLAEFGTPSSWGDAHVALSGMDHGGHDEETEGRNAVRMFHNMAEAGCAGGALFNWIDEWWKNCWITSQLDFPLTNRPCWLNVTSPEQNFGLIAFDEAPPTFAPVPMAGNPGPVSGVSWVATGRFFHLEIATDPAQRPLTIGFDTYRDDLGETVLPGGIVTTTRCELALVLDASNQAQLYVTRAYDLFGIWHDQWGYVNDTNQLYHSIATDGAPWNRVRWLSNRAHGSGDGKYSFPETIDPIGQLRVSTTNAFVTSLDAVAVSNRVIRLRLPWTLLQFTDPTQLRVMDDDRATPLNPYRETAQSDGIRLVIAQGSGLLVSTNRLLWSPRTAAPPTTEREKASVPILEQYLLAFDYSPEIRIRIVDRTADTLTLDWEGGGILEAAPSLTGSWTPVGEGAPTFVPVLPSGRQFFRVKR